MSQSRLGIRPLKINSAVELELCEVAVFRRGGDTKETDDALHRWIGFVFFQPEILFGQTINAVISRMRARRRPRIKPPPAAIAAKRAFMNIEQIHRCDNNRRFYSCRAVRVHWWRRSNDNRFQNKPARLRLHPNENLSRDNFGQDCHRKLRLARKIFQLDQRASSNASAP